MTPRWLSNRRNDRRLIQFAEDCKWALAVERAQSHPKEIDMVDESGFTVFHHICCGGAPLPALQWFIELDKNQHAKDPRARAVLKCDASGMTPLMNACSQREVSLVQELVGCAPEKVSWKSGCGQNAGHEVMMSLCRENVAAALDIIEILFHRDPSLRHAIDIDGETMMSIFLKGPLHFFLNECVQSCPEEGGGSAAVRSLFHKLTCGEKDEPNENIPPLNRLLQCQEFPLSCLERVVKLRPMLVCEKDGNGTMPLHVAASNLNPSKEMGRFSDIFPKNRLAFLVEKDPSAARKRNNDGLLPLQLLAMKASKSNNCYASICSPLLDANPSAIDSFHFQDGMCPYVLARAKRNPNTMFLLLSAKPNLVQWASEALSQAQTNEENTKGKLGQDKNCCSCCTVL